MGIDLVQWNFKFKAGQIKDYLVVCAKKCMAKVLQVAKFEYSIYVKMYSLRAIVSTNY